MPYRSDQGGPRDESFSWLMSRWARVAPGVEVCVSDSGPGNFSRSKARNLAIAAATRDILLIADADSFVDTQALRSAVYSTLSSNDRWCLPFEVYLNLDQRSSQSILESSPEVTPNVRSLTWDHWIPGPSSPPAMSGVLVVPAAGMQAAGGYDERFEGWGFEDTAMARALDTMWGRHERVTGYCYHLWHPVAKGTTFDSPTASRNRSLFMKYDRAYGNPSAMRKVLER